MRYALIVTVAILTACGGNEAPKGELFTVKGVALGGYDPVAYFEVGEAREGNANTTSSYGGVIYQFTSTKHKELFDASPDQYLPEYGGWCAYAVAENSTKMEPDPTMWQIQNGKLQLFYDDWMTSLTGKLIDEWNTDPENYEEKADANWEVIK